MPGQLFALRSSLWKQESSSQYTQLVGEMSSEVFMLYLFIFIAHMNPLVLLDCIVSTI